VEEEGLLCSFEDLAEVDGGLSGVINGAVMALVAAAVNHPRQLVSY